ncbi:MAG: GNAT family N-acyltransferase [bacterium]
MAEKANPDGVFHLPLQRISNLLLRNLLLPARPMLEWMLGIPKLNATHYKASQMDPALAFADRTLQVLGVSYLVADEERAAIPATGPVVVVANHPFGGVEGVILLSLLQSARPDVRCMANFMLGAIPEMREQFILVDPFGARSAASRNSQPMKDSLRWLQGGGMLGIFPAGEVSSFDLHCGLVRDPAWDHKIAAIVRHTQATVLPVYFHGHNGFGFQAAGVIHPRLRTLLLPRQLTNKQGQELRLRVGSPIPWKDMADISSDEKLIRFLRLRTYLLAERESRRRRPFFIRLPRALPADPVCLPAPAETYAREIAALPPEQKMIESGDMEVYVAQARQAPALMREIGRLREITFRAVGEGTGEALDIDRFDKYYWHLFMWNKARQEVVGGYRLGMADRIVDDFGVKGLYTRTVFRFDERFLNRIQPAIELGRSFVRPEYQRAYTSLLLLWKGISAFIGKNPRYRILFGPVSITNEYREASRNMIIESLRRIRMSSDLADLVKPRRPPRPPRTAEWNQLEYRDFFDDMDQVAGLVEEVEPDHKGIPVLLRQYLKLGGRLVAFNVDPDFSFVVDGLILVDLKSADPKTLRRYMGNDVADSYLRFHGMLEPPEARSEANGLPAAGTGK